MKNGINLIPDEIRREKTAKKLRAGLVAVAIVYAVVLGVIYAGQRAGISERKDALKEVEAQREGLLTTGARQTDLGRKLAEIKKTEALLTQKLGATAGIEGKRIAWAYVFKRLSHEVPEGVWLRSISTSEADPELKRFRLTGSATSNRPIASFISALENSGIFKDLSLTYTQKREHKTGTVYDFELYMDLKRTEETVHEW